MAKAADSYANVIFPSYRRITQKPVKNAETPALTVYLQAIDDPHAFKRFTDIVLTES